MGDFARAYDNAVAGESAWFYWINRGKRRNLFDDHQAQGGNTYVMQFRLKTFGFRMENSITR